MESHGDESGSRFDEMMELLDGEVVAIRAGIGWWNRDEVWRQAPLVRLFLEIMTACGHRAKQL